MKAHNLLLFKFVSVWCHQMLGLRSLFVLFLQEISVILTFWSCKSGLIKFSHTFTLFVFFKQLHLFKFHMKVFTHNVICFVINTLFLQAANWKHAQFSLIRKIYLRKCSNFTWNGYVNLSVLKLPLFIWGLRPFKKVLQIVLLWRLTRD